MLNSLSILFRQIGEIWKQFGTTQRMSTTLGLLFLIGAVGGLFYWSTQPDYRLLYSNLSLGDAATMREKLEESKIAVRIGQSGMSISVPAADLYTARLMLASAGLPNDASTGFELFEQPKFGLTDFAQKVNYQRALQGELERTISAMQGISSARIMLVLPKERLFSSPEDMKAQASILLNLNGSIALSDSQVQSIVHLVSGSVQNLDPNQVAVSDQHGRMLTRTRSTDDSFEHSSEQIEIQAKTERRLAEKAQAILDRALGMGNSIVRVNVAMDFSDSEERSEIFDPEGRVVKSERISSEDQATGGGGKGGRASGRPGVVANVSVGDPSAMQIDDNSSNNKKEDITTEYAVPSKVILTKQKGSRMQSVSVAVCLAQGDEARSEVELETIRGLIINAVGLNTKREDTIHITEMPFSPTPEAPKAKWWASMPISLDSIFKGVGGLAVLGLIYGVSRKMQNAMMAANPASESSFGKVRETVQEQLVSDEPLVEFHDQLDMITSLANDNPKMVAAWINNKIDWAS